MLFKRYAIYHLSIGDFHELGSAWLGWNNRLGTHCVPTLGQDWIVERPKKYGFHATIKAPFRIADGCSERDLIDAFDTFCQSIAPVTTGVCDLRRIGRFLAITPTDPPSDLNDLAARSVKYFDAFRAPLEQEDIDRRRKSRLTPDQDALMLRWGYPFIFEHFKYHLTLTGPLPAEQIDTVENSARNVFRRFLKGAYGINTLSLMGEDIDGYFHEVQTRQLAQTE